MLPNLKLLRREYGISQQKLADALGSSQQSINQYENHSIEPDIEMLCRMADYFESSVDFIVGHTEIRRRIESTEAYDLNEAESALIRRYRALSPRERDCVNHVIEVLMEK